MKIKVYQIIILVVLIIVVILGTNFIKKKIYNYQYRNRINELISDNIEI